MRRIFVGWRALAICALVAGGAMAPRAGAQMTAHHRVTVKPAVGYPGTWFRVLFRAPDSAGQVHGMWRYYVIQIIGPRGSGTCVRQATKYVRSARAGQRVRVALRPGRHGWCPGSFEGTVTEQEQPVCQFREVCPNYVVLVRTIGRFAFQVDAQPAGGAKSPRP